MRVAKVVYLDDNEADSSGNCSIDVCNVCAEAEIVIHRGVVVKNRCGPTGKIVPESVLVRSHDFAAFDMRLDVLDKQVSALKARVDSQPADAARAAA